MFAGKSSIGNICRIHFQTLQVFYSSYDKSYHDLLNFSNGVSIHHRHLRFLASKVYKTLMNINPEFMWGFFNKSPVQHNLQKRDIVYHPHARSTSYRINSLALHWRLLWNSLPSNAKQSHNLEELKLKLTNLEDAWLVVETNLTSSFYCLFYVYLMIHLCYVFYILNLL